MAGAFSLSLLSVGGGRNAAIGGSWVQEGIGELPCDVMCSHLEVGPLRQDRTMVANKYHDI